MPLPAVSAMGTERKITSFAINLPDVSFCVAVLVKESCGTAGSQGSTQSPALLQTLLRLPGAVHFSAKMFFL